MYDLVLEKKKSKNGVEYLDYSVDFGFKKQSITMNRTLMAVLLKITEEQLYFIAERMNIDDCIILGSYGLEGLQDLLKDFHIKE